MVARPSAVRPPFLEPGYCKVKRDNKSLLKRQQWVYLGATSNYPRDALRVLNKHRNLFITCYITCTACRLHHQYLPKCITPWLRTKGGFETVDEKTSNRGVGGVLDDQDNGLDRLNDPDVTWGLICARGCT